MLHLVKFKMPLTCFMSLEAEGPAGWDDGMQTGVQSPNMSLEGQV